MVTVWQFQDARNRLSELVERAERQGPQVITRRGNEVAVVLSYSDYRKLVGAQKPLSEFFRRSPLADVELDLYRDQGVPREAEEL